MSTAQIGWGLGGILVAVLIAALGWGIAHPALRPAGAAVGGPAPALVVRGLDGSAVSLADLRGRPVVVNFWASWCPPCRQEDAVLQAAARKAPSVAFLGVDIQDTEAAARAYEDRAEDPYPVGPATSGGASAWGVTAPPETFFIDASGGIRAHVIGPLSAAEMDQYLRLIAA